MKEVTMSTFDLLARYFFRLGAVERVDVAIGWPGLGRDPQLVRTADIGAIVRR